MKVTVAQPAARPTRTGFETSRGFTLIELSILLAVFAIGAAIVVPSFIESARNTLVEKAAQDVLRIQDAAKWYYMGSNLDDPAEGRLWPGEVARDVCVNSPATRQALIDEEFVDAASIDNNPWGLPYAVTVEPGCLFRVTTQVPSSAAPIFVDMLPTAACGGGGMATCTSDIPRPGSEPHLVQDVDSEQELSRMACGQLGGTMVVPGGFCTIDTSERPTNCGWSAAGLCPGGKVLMNTRCADKYCRPIELYCCDVATF